MDLSTQTVKEIDTMQRQTKQMPPPGEAALDADARAALLAEVDFKWLMTGHGWWIDAARFHCDPSYAADLLRLAMASPSFALRDCAAFLQAQTGVPAASAMLPAAGFPASGQGSL